MGTRRRRIMPAKIAGYIITFLIFSNSFAADEFDKEFEAFQKSINSQQNNNQRQSFNNEFDAFLKEAKAQQQAEAREFANYKREIEKQWDEFRASTKKQWVDYGNNKSSRSIVDFEKGKVTIEVVLPVQTNKKPSNKQSAELRLAALKKMKKQLEKILTDTSSIGGESPIQNQLKTESGKKLTKKNVENFTKKTLDKKVVVKNKPFIAKDGTPRIKAQVTVKMVPNHLKIRADKYRKPVKKYAKQYNVAPSLVFAVIHTESYFNPKARSPIPAYGLMQLVPSSGGRDAYRKAFGKDKAPSASYLYKPNQNIQLGTAYLAVLAGREFKKVTDEKSKTYLMIAAYNTGGGNVSRAITGNKNIYKASNKINGMSSQQIYSTLVNKLPYDETRQYVKKVTKRQNIYQNY